MESSGGGKNYDERKRTRTSLGVNNVYEKSKPTYTRRSGDVRREAR